MRKRKDVDKLKPSLIDFYKQANDLEKMRRNLEEMQKHTHRQQEIAKNAPGPNLDELKRGSQQVTDTILERGQAHQPNTPTSPTPLPTSETVKQDPPKKPNPTKTQSTPPTSKPTKTVVPKGMSKGKVVGGLAGAAAIGLGAGLAAHKKKKKDDETMEQTASVTLNGLYKEANDWLTPDGQQVTKKTDPELMELLRQEQYFLDREMESQRWHDDLVDSKKRARRDQDFIVGSGVGALLGSAAGLKNKKNLLPGAILGGMAGAPGGLVAGAALGRYKEKNIAKDPFVTSSKGEVDYYYNQGQDVSGQILDHVEEKGYKQASATMDGLYKEANYYVTQDGKPVTSEVDSRLIDLMDQRDALGEKEDEALGQYGMLNKEEANRRSKKDTLIGAGTGALLGSAAGLKNKKHLSTGLVLGAGAGAVGGSLTGLALGRYKPENIRKDVPDVVLANEQYEDYFDERTKLDDEISNYANEQGYKYASSAMDALYKEAAPGFKMPVMNNMFAPKNMAPGKITASPQPFSGSNGMINTMNQSKMTTGVTPKPMQTNMNSTLKPQGNNSSMTRLASVAMDGMFSD